MESLIKHGRQAPQCVAVDNDIIFYDEQGMRKERPTLTDAHQCVLLDSQWKYRAFMDLFLKRYLLRVK